MNLWSLMQAEEAVMASHRGAAMELRRDTFSHSFAEISLYIREDITLERRKPWRRLRVVLVTEADFD